MNIGDKVEIVKVPSRCLLFPSLKSIDLLDIKIGDIGTVIGEYNTNCEAVRLERTGENFLITNDCIELV